MTSEQQMVILVHAALQRAGHERAALPSSPGYIVAVNKTFDWQPAEIEVSHIPVGDEPESHAQQYFGILSTDQTLSGFAVQLVSHPYPKVVIRG